MAGADPSETVEVQIDNSPFGYYLRWQTSKQPSVTELRDFYTTVARCMRMENSLPRALNLVLGLVSSPSLMYCTAEAVQALQTKPVAESMEVYRNVLPDAHVSMIAVGAEAGELPAVLDSIAAGVTRSSKAIGRLQSAMYYPAFVMIMGVVVVFFVSYKLLPSLQKIFIAMKAELPLPTRILVAIIDFAKDYPLVPIAGVLALGYLVINFKTIARAPAVQMAIAKMPIFGRILFKADLSKCLMSLGLMLKAGLPLQQALALCITVATDVRLQKFFSALHYSHAQEGKTIFEIASRNRALLGEESRLMVPMMRIGEQTGSMRDTFDKLSEYYADEVEGLTKTAETLVEPLSYVALAGLVFFLVMAVFYPMLKLNVLIMPK
jgi:type II secretory pathway component PulF